MPKPDARSIDGEHWGYLIGNKIESTLVKGGFPGSSEWHQRLLPTLAIKPGFRRAAFGLGREERFLTIKAAVKEIEAGVRIRFRIEKTRIEEGGARYMADRHHVFWEAVVAETARRGLDTPNSEVLNVAGEVMVQFETDEFAKQQADLQAANERRAQQQRG